MRSPFAERERERLIAAILPDVAFDGWTGHALRNAARRIDIPAGEALALFPRGAADMIAEFSRWADYQMLERLATAPPESSLSRRIALKRPKPHELQQLRDQIAALSPDGMAALVARSTTRPDKRDQARPSACPRR